MNSSLQSVQSRHILALIGIDRWVDRACQSYTMPKLADGFNNPRIQHLIPQKTKPITPHIDEKTSFVKFVPAPNTDAQKSLSDTLPSLLPSLDVMVSPQTKLQTKLQVTPQIAPQIQNTILKSDIRFHLQGVRFGNWVLVVDLLGLDDELIMIWRSLKQALATHAHQHSIYHHDHEAYYPMMNVDNDYAEHKNLVPADGVFWGFLFGLSIDDGTQLAYLTTLPDGLPDVLDECMNKLPSLDELAKQPTLKKQFWESVTQNP